MAERILKILEELRDLGVLHPIPHGADRQVREAVEWNGFVEKGRSGISEYGLRDLMTSPMEGLDDTGLAWHLKQKQASETDQSSLF